MEVKNKWRNVLRWVLFIGIWFSILTYLFGAVIWNYFPEGDPLADPLYRAEASMNFLMILAFYIAWRVTP